MIDNMTGSTTGSGKEPVCRDDVSVNGVSIAYDDWQPGDPLPYAYALVYRLGGMYLGAACNIPDWEEVTEARFFDEQGERHIWNDGDGFHSVQVTEQADTGNPNTSNTIDRLWLSRSGEVLTSRQYLGADEDGQACIALTRLLRYEKDGGNRLSAAIAEEDVAEEDIEAEAIEAEATEADDSEAAGETADQTDANGSGSTIATIDDKEGRR